MDILSSFSYFLNNPKYRKYKTPFTSNQKFSKSLLGLGAMVRVGVRIISWYIWCNFEKFINCRTRSFIKSLYNCRTRHSVTFKQFNSFSYTYCVLAHIHEFDQKWKTPAKLKTGAVFKNFLTANQRRKTQVLSSFWFKNRKTARGFRCKQHQTCHKIWNEIILWWVK